MTIINLMTGLVVLLFFALSMAIISRLNSLSLQRERIHDKLRKAMEEENKLEEPAAESAA